MTRHDASVCRIGGSATTYRKLDEQSGRFAAGPRELGGEVLPRTADDTAVLVYTSGTTGNASVSHETRANPDALSPGGLLDPNVRGSHPKLVGCHPGR